MENALHTAALAAFVDHHMQAWTFESPFDSSDDIFTDLLDMNGGPFDTWPTTLPGLVRDVLADLFDLDFVDQPLADCIDWYVHFVENVNS